MSHPANRAELYPHFLESGAHGVWGLVQHIENQYVFSCAKLQPEKHALDAGMLRYVLCHYAHHDV